MKTFLLVCAVCLGTLLGSRALSRLTTPPAKPDVLASCRAEIPVRSGDVVFLGDSIASLPEWHELLGTAETRNRAVAGTTTTTFLQRPTPRADTVVLALGINDLQRGIPREQTRANLREIAERLQGARVILIPAIAPEPATFRRVLVPHHPRIHLSTPAEVAEVNATLREAFPAARIADVAAMLTADGHLRPELTDDGLHPNGRGYVILADVVRGALGHKTITNAVD